MGLPLFLQKVNCAHLEVASELSRSFLQRRLEFLSKRRFWLSGRCRRSRALFVEGDDITELGLLSPSISRKTLNGQHEFKILILTTTPDLGYVNQNTYDRTSRVLPYKLKLDKNWIGVYVPSKVQRVTKMLMFLG